MMEVVPATAWSALIADRSPFTVAMPAQSAARRRPSHGTPGRPSNCDRGPIWAPGVTPDRTADVITLSADPQKAVIMQERLQIVSNEVWDEARAVLSEKEVANIVMAVIMMNVFNRIAISIRKTPTLDA